MSVDDPIDNVEAVLERNVDQEQTDHDLEMNNYSTNNDGYSRESHMMESETNLQNRKQKKKKSVTQFESSVVVNYHGTNIFQAASQGNLPLCVLLWGMASAKRLSLMALDSLGNNPIHFAALADTTEVVGFFMQQTKGFLTSSLRVVDSRNHAGETALLRAMTTGVIPVAKVSDFLGILLFFAPC